MWWRWYKKTVLSSESDRTHRGVARRCCRPRAAVEIVVCLFLTKLRTSMQGLSQFRLWKCSDLTTGEMRLTNRLAPCRTAAPVERAVFEPFRRQQTVKLKHSYSGTTTVRDALTPVTRTAIAPLGHQRCSCCRPLSHGQSALYLTESVPIACPLLYELTEEAFRISLSATLLTLSVPN
jgi:hypothetical protein